MKFLHAIADLELKLRDPKDAKIPVTMKASGLRLQEILRVMMEEVGLVPVLLPDGSDLLFEER